jgi:polyisoprenoid-binding protein YceI
MQNFVLALLLAVTWSADPVHSSANFTVTHLGISHVNGIIPIKNSNIDVPEGSNIPTSADATFDPSGIDTRNSDRDSDLRSPHFFEVTTYPVMSFKSTKISATPRHHAEWATTHRVSGKNHDRPHPVGHDLR